MSTPGQRPIDRELWQKISSVFADAIELPTSEREQFLREACAGSPQIESQVRGLLAEHDQAVGFLEPESLTQTIANNRAAAGRAFRLGKLLCSRFQIVRLLGAGGMGEVYEALDSELRQRVAIKTLRSSYARDPEMVERFRAEVLRSRQITHPNVARVYDLFTHRGKDGVEIPFFTMELLEGQTLSRWLDAHGPLTPEEALPLIRQMASALHAAHSVGIVHRDFKPGNVFISSAAGEEPKAIVTDFGIAAQLGAAPDLPDGVSSPPSGASLLAGTPAYMAPERLFGAPSAPTDDTYALGLVAYEMLTGERAYDVKSPLACALRKAGDSDPKLLADDSKLPKRWIEAIHRAVRRDPLERFSDPLEFAGAIAGKPAGARTAQILGLLLAAILAAIVFFAVRAGRDAPSQPVSLAVLPFQNAGGEAQAAYLSDGIAEGLIRSLTGFAKLRVAPQRAAAAYRDGRQPPAEIARALDVQTLLVGTFRQTGHKLHISAELRDRAKNKPIWTQDYDGDMEQLLTMQADIVKQAAARLAPGAAQPDVPVAPTANTEAYDRYLQARYLWQTRTRDGITKAIDYFNQAVQLDPKFALSYAGIADAYMLLADFGSIAPVEAAPKAREAIQRALSLDSDAAEVQASLGFFEMSIVWDQTGAERAFQRALARNPSLVNAHHWYAGYLERERRLDEALREAQEARRLDPTTPPTLLIAGWVQYYRRDFAAAIEIGKRAVELYPGVPQGHDLLAFCYADSGQPQLALRESTEAVKLTADPSQALRRRAATLARISGYEAEARQAATQLEKLSWDRQAAYLVDIYGALHDRERMYTWAERALEIHDTYLLIANVDPPLEVYRKEPHFQEILHRMGY